jgi:hypothetical protein
MPGKDHVVEIRMMPHHELSDKRLSIYLNGARAADIVSDEKWHVYKAALPGDLIKRRLNILSFKPSQTIVTDEIFGGAWSKGTPIEQLRKMFLLSQKDDETIIFDWEQDNIKFRKHPISFAVDYLRITN